MATSVSVITLHKDRPQHLCRLLEGLACTGFNGELVVAEMGAMTTLSQQPFPVAQVPAAGRLPLAQARNVGRKVATGTNLIFLDVDCIPASNLTAALSAALEQHDAFICADVHYLADEVVDGWTEADLLIGSQPHPERIFPLRGLREATNPGLFWSLAFGVRSETFDRLNGFDEIFIGYGGEDTDLAFRAHEAQIPLLLCADAIAFHQPHETCEPPLQHFVDIMRNAAIFRARHNIWPMQGWLDGFQALGLIERVAADYRIVREPTLQEISDARVLLA